MLDARARVLGSMLDAPGSSRPHRPRAGNATLPTAAELFVPSLPGVPDLASHPTHPINLYAGEIPSYPGAGKGGGDGQTGVDAHIFFMMARARRSAGRQRVIFWFNGGPGCSSFDGALMEVGPFRTVPKEQTESGQAELKLVEGGWEEFATVVFVDQPPGTGLSYIPTDGYLHELDQASAHFIQFLHNFYQVFPELAAQDTYLAGESFAGQYIPYFADALIKTDRLPKLNLQGIAIGNGWIDPIRQYPAYAEFAYTRELIKQDSQDGEFIDAQVEVCNKAIAEKYSDPDTTPINISECELIMLKVRAPFDQQLNGKAMCMNIYDVRLTDESPACGMNWPPDLTDVYDFLRRKDVVSSLHADMHVPAWTECSSRVSSQLRNHKSPASVRLLPGILEAGVRVLMFAGAEDLICNYVGIERMIDALEWNGQKGFGNATMEKWSLNGTDVGEWTDARNMSYVKVFDASHMVGFDVPQVTNDMIMRFMGVDMKLVPGEMGDMESKVGEDARLAVQFGPAPEDKGMPLLKGGHGDWEAWYNAISAVLILLTLAGIVGFYLWFRARRLRKGKGPVALDGEREREERVPLAEEYELAEEGRRDKGKGRAREEHDEEEEFAERRVFALEDEDDNER